MGDACSICSRPLAGETCLPGPGWGRVHQSCFDQVDARSEALEREPFGLLALEEIEERPSRFGRARPATVERARARLAAHGIEVRP